MRVDLALPIRSHPRMPEISLRDYFAAKAIEGILQTQRITRPVDENSQRNRENDLAELARDAYDVADALLARRKELLAKEAPRDLSVGGVESPNKW